MILRRLLVALTVLTLVALALARVLAPAPPPAYSYHLDGHLGRPYAILAAGGRLWVSNLEGLGTADPSGYLLGLAPGRPDLVVRGPASGLYHPSVLCADGRYLWAISPLTSTLTEIDAATGRVLRVISQRQLAYDLYLPEACAVSHGNLWVANSAYASPISPVIAANLTELNAVTGRLVRVVNGTGRSWTAPIALTAYRGSLLLSNVNPSAPRASLVEVSARGRFLRDLTRSIPGLSLVVAAIVAHGNVWLADAVAGTVLVVAPRTHRVLLRLDPFSTSSSPVDLLYTSGLVLVAGSGGAGIDPALSAVDVHTGHVRYEILSPGAADNLTRLALYRGHVWVTDYDTHELIEVSPSTGRVLSVTYP